MRTKDLVDAEVFNLFIQSESVFPSIPNAVLTLCDSPKLIYSPPLTAVGGYRREEAIMLLRRFYVTENAHGQSSPPGQEL